VPTAPLYQFVTKTPVQRRDDILRVLKVGLQSLGIPNPNVGPGSDYWILATGIANELSVVDANTTLLADQLMPDTAAGAQLDRILAIYGQARRAAQGSIGVVQLQTNQTSGVPIPAGQQLTDTSNLRYQTVVSGTYGSAYPNNIVSIQAVDVGFATNHANGDRLRWVEAPPFSDQFAIVGTPGGADGLSNGSDSEANDDETPRARLLALLAGQTAPMAGNWAHVAMLCAQSSPRVQAGFVYPAAQGPASMHFAVTAPIARNAQGAITSMNRDVDATTLNNVVVPYVQGLLPEHVAVTGTTVTNQNTDIAIVLSLPSAPNASPAGPGGGWLDGTPWPSSISGTTPVTVTSTVDTQHFTVNATTAPIVGASHIAWLSPSNWTLYTANVTAVSGSSGSYNLTLDTPMPGISNGNYIWPQSANQQIYVNALLQAFGLMGPGEKDASFAFNRDFRHPQPSVVWPYSLGGPILRALTNAGPEVFSASFIYQLASTPTVPGTITSPPNILVPRNVAFYAV
jgi:uncharacterized phage protein gp47/JayE